MDIKGLVSVIIPTYGRAEKLNEAINSVLAQTYSNIEVIVVNDNDSGTRSYKDTENIMQEYNNNGVVKYIADGINRGGSEARNKGIEHASGEYITFLDDDDCYYNNKIEMQLKHLIESNADVSVCDMDMYLDGVKMKNKKSKALIGSLGDFIINGNAFTPMIMSKSSVIHGVGAFSVTPRFQDHILMLKILGGNYRVEILSKPLFIHNIHKGDGITSVHNFEKGYMIRHEIEAKFSNRLSKEQRNRFYLMHYLTMARLSRNKDRKFTSVKYIIKSFCLVRGGGDLLKVAKRSLGILLYRKSRG